MSLIYLFLSLGEFVYNPPTSHGGGNENRMTKVNKKNTHFTSAHTCKAQRKYVLFKFNYCGNSIFTRIQKSKFADKRISSACCYRFFFLLQKTKCVECIFNNLISVIVEQKTGKKIIFVESLKCSITTHFQVDVKPLRRHSY